MGPFRWRAGAWAAIVPMVLLLLAADGAAVVARTGRQAPGGPGTGSARSASVGRADLDDIATPPVDIGGGADVGPAVGNQAGGSPTSTVHPSSATGATSTTTARPIGSPTTATTTTSTTLPVGDVTGPGLYVLNADGTGVRRLSDTYGMFSWSPDGSRIVYPNGSHLHVVRVDGSSDTILPAGEGALAPAWSPDGSRIAFSRSGGGAYVLRADGSGTAVLADPVGHLVAWTPDSRLVTISAAGAGAGAPVLTLHEVDGSARVLATGVPPFVQPAPSPDGQRVAYLGEGIQSIGVDGSDPRTLTARCCGNESVASPMRWSPDSRLLAYIDGRDVRVVGADGTGGRTLAADADDPAWSPDGTRVALIDERVTRADGLLHLTLQVMGVAGSNRRTIFDAGQKMSVAEPQWSPNSRQLAVLVVTDGLLGFPG